MTCNLLHIIADPDPVPYSDPDVKDVVGHLPKFRCAHCTPLRQLAPSEAAKCLARDVPCWRPQGTICD